MAASQTSARAGAWLAVALLLGGCPGDTNLPPRDGSAPVVQISGRVVDLETCVSEGGCAGVANLRVSLFYDATTVSDKTGPEGGFSLRGVPGNRNHYLLVSDALGTGVIVSCLQAEPVATASVDVFGVELYAVRRQGGLYAAIAQEAAVDLATHAIYVGQVFYLKGGTSMTALADASAVTTPSLPVRYVSCNPRFKDPVCPAALFDAKRATTGPLGEFVALGQGKLGDVKIAVTSPNHTFTQVSAPLGNGYLTVGTHQGKAKPTDGGGS